MNAALEVLTHCTSCGQSLPADAAFCPGCGKRAAQVATSAPTLLADVTSVQKPRSILGIVLAGAGFVGLLVLLLVSLRPHSHAPVATAQRESIAHLAPEPKRTPPDAATNGFPQPVSPTALTTPAAEPDGSPSLPVRILEDKRLGFQIEIPQGWVTEPEQDGYAISPADDNPDTTEISGTLTVVPRHKGDTLQDQSRRVKEGLRELTKLVMDGEETLTLAGHPALRLNFHHFQPAAEEEYAGISIVVERDTDFIHLALSCTADRRQRYEPILNRLISSLRSTTPAP